MADVTDQARVVALDRLCADDIASRSGDLLDVVFAWADFTRLRRQVKGQCAAAGLTGSRLDDFVLAVHEIAANTIVHAGAGGGLILRRAADGLRCLIADRVLGGDEDFGASGAWGASEVPRPREGGDRDDLREPSCTETGRGLWLAAQLADELIITSGPDSTIVSLYISLD